MYELLNGISITFFVQICRNINRIKVCMETGRTVILLNLESLYESLYDALNQVRILISFKFFSLAQATIVLNSSSGQL